jgi:hypothetical protein
MHALACRHDRAHRNRLRLVLAARAKQGCAETRIPNELPPASAVVDPAAALTELRQSGALGSDMRFSLLFDDTDSFPRIRPLESTDPKAAIVLMRSIWPQKPSGTWAVRVHVTGGAAPSVALERSIYCPPTPERGSPFRERVAVQMPRGRPPAGFGNPEGPHSYRSTHRRWRDAKQRQDHPVIRHD